jgi:hypothetical protein
MESKRKLTVSMSPDAEERARKRKKLPVSDDVLMHEKQCSVVWRKAAVEELNEPQGL